MHAVLTRDLALQIVRFLLRGGADVHVQDARRGRTALHFAAHDQRTTLVRILLDAGSKADALDAFGNTPLWQAVIGGGSPALVRMLLEAGADPHRSNRNGVPPREVAVRLRRQDLLDLMAKLKARKTMAATPNRAHPLKNGRAAAGPPRSHT